MEKYNYISSPHKSTQSCIREGVPYGTIIRNPWSRPLMRLFRGRFYLKKQVCDGPMASCEDLGCSVSCYGGLEF